MTRVGRTLVVNACDPEETRIALVDGTEIHALRCAHPERGSVVGNVYLGVVRKIEPGLDAAFIDFGEKRAAFLHVGNVHPACADPKLSAVEIAGTPLPRRAHDSQDAEEVGAAEPEEVEVETATSAPKIGELLQPGRQVLVQVLRDPVRGKGATVTMHLSLAGFCLVWMPTLGRIGVSRRIEESEERERLRQELLELGKGEELSVIARTAAAGQPKKILAHDLRRLQERWATIQRDFAHAKAPCLALAEESPAMRACRELFHGGVEEIVCDDPATLTQLASFLGEKGADERVNLIAHEGDIPLFEARKLEPDYQSLFRSRVSMGGGASIVIHETEALTAIDVNSGRADEESLEQTALSSNLLAAKEVARQVRLRDLGGILVVDFIDMADPENRRQVEQALREGLRTDRARMKTGRLGSFGLMTFTRRRQGTGLIRASESMCRGCGGSGNIAHHQAGLLRLLRRLRALPAPSRIRVRAQPGVARLWKRLGNPLEGLGHTVEMVEDPQVPSGDSVLERLGTLAEADGGS